MISPDRPTDSLAEPQAARRRLGTGREARFGAQPGRVVAGGDKQHGYGAGA